VVSVLNKVLIYQFIAKNSFRQRFAYRSGVWVQIFSGIFFVFIQGSLWTALIKSSYTDITLHEMISFVIINSLVTYITFFNEANLIGSRVRDGSIATDMILPVSFKWRVFSENFGCNLFDLFFAGTPALMIALLFYGAATPVSLSAFALFLPSLLLGILLSYQIKYLFSLTAFWIINPWYISFLTSGLTKLFGGAVVPLWFYPVWLSDASSFFPFRFITYEPIQIYLGRVRGMNAAKSILMQTAWLVILFLLEQLIWSKASKKVFVQGG